MRPNLEQDQLIDRFLRHEMTQEERASFESMVEGDELVRDEVMLRKDIIVGIQAAERQMLKDRLTRVVGHRVAKADRSTGYAQGQFRRYRWAIAIGVAIAVLLVLLTYLLTR